MGHFNVHTWLRPSFSGLLAPKSTEPRVHDHTTHDTSGKALQQHNNTLPQRSPQRRTNKRAISMPSSQATHPTSTTRGTPSPGPPHQARRERPASHSPPQENPAPLHSLDHNPAWRTKPQIYFIVGGGKSQGAEEGALAFKGPYGLTKTFIII